VKVAAALSWLAGLGFGLPCVYAIGYFARRGEVWTFLGFPTYGDGPFARIGIETSVPLLVGFLVVCVAELVVGVLLWQGLTVGAWAALVLLPVELVFWAGFALPFGFVLGLARTALVVVALAR
jgi:hypothetical protein